MVYKERFSGLGNTWLDGNTGRGKFDKAIGSVAGSVTGSLWTAARIEITGG
jgi:hypothetical protein